MADAREIAEGLTEAQHGLWRRTVLVLVATKPKRRAFLAGYNGVERLRHHSPALRESYRLGQQVRDILKEPDHG